MNFNSENGRRRFNIILFWQVLILLALILTFLGKQFLAFNSKAEDTLSITKLSQVSTDLNQTLSGKDAFSLALAENSKVTASSNAVKLNRNTYQFNAVNNEISGEVTYSNAGITASGKLIDAVLTVTAQNASKVTVAPIGSITLTGRNAKAQMKLQFFIHGTKTPIAIDGHFTIDQLNPNEEIGLKLNQLKQIYSRGDSLVQTNSDQRYTNFKVNTLSEHNRFTAVYENQTELDYTLKNTGAEAGQLNLSSSSVVEIEMPQARMTGVDETVDPAESSEETKTDQFQGKLTETKAAPNKVRPLYLLQQNIPSKSAGYLGWNQIDDELDPVWSVEPKDIVITNELQEDVTNNFQVMIKGHHLTIDAAAEALKSSDFYGHTYSILIKGRINPQQELQSDKDDLKLGKPNSAKITLKTAGGVVTQKTNPAVNQVKVALPKVELDQSSIYSGMKTFSGKISHPETTKFYLSYKDNAGKTHDNEPLKITTKPNLTANALTARSADTKEKWQAAMPENLNAKAAPVKLTAKSVDGMKKDFWMRDGTWWDYNATTKVLTIHPHELNFDVDKAYSGWEYYWPWIARNSIGNQVKKVILEPGVTAKGSLEKLFTGLNYVDSYEGLDLLNTSQVTNMSEMFSNNNYGNLTTLDVSHFDTSNVTDMHQMFSNSAKLVNLDVSYFNTSNVTDMGAMFAGCPSLANLDVSHFDTSKVTNMNNMFSKVTSLLDLQNFDTSQVKDMSFMFSRYGGSSLDFSNRDTSSVTTMRYMFQNSTCPNINLSGLTNGQVTNMSYMFDNSKVVNLNLSDFSTSNVTDMSYMFQSTSGLTNLDFRQWTKFDTSKVTDMNHMFNSSNISSLNIETWDTSNVTYMYYMFSRLTKITSYSFLNSLKTGNVTTMEGMFSGSTNLGGIDFSQLLNFDTSKVVSMAYMFNYTDISPNANVRVFNTSKVTDMTSMFEWCSKLTIFDLNSWDTRSLKLTKSMFKNCSNLSSVKVSDWDTGALMDTSLMFQDCSSLENLNLTNWNVSNVTLTSSMFAGCSKLVSVGDLINWQTRNITSTYKMFYNCYKLNGINVANWNTSQMIDLSYMFSGCWAFTSLAVTNWDLSNAINTSHMFEGCGNVPQLDVSQWHASKITDLSYMFSGCKSLKHLDFNPTFDISNVTNLSYTFFSCIALETLPISSWNTAKVTNMYYTFGGCSSLTTLDISNWNTAKVTNMGGTFSGCSKLTNLDVSKWQTGLVTLMGSMFSNCSSLKSLDLSTFNTNNLIDMELMFGGCSSLENLNLTGFNTSKVGTVSYFPPGNYYSSIGSMRNLFYNCSSLTTLDLSSFDTTNLSKLAYYKPKSYQMNGMFYNTKNLWKLTLGPKMKIYPKAKSSSGWETFDPNFANPSAGTKINDPADPTGNYYATEAKWQELGTSNNDHEPNGGVKTADDIIADSQVDHTDTRTYVWYQVGSLNFTAPTEIDLGSHKISGRFEEGQSEAQSLEITDSRNGRANKQWRIDVAASDLVKSDDTTKKVAGNPLYIKDSAGEHQLTSTATSLYSGVSGGVGYADTWSKSWNLLFRSAPSAIPASGTYNGTVTFTLVDTTP
ncbi:BspA family leucine-rich repeat surface protein [Xylocopilactobacillus apis]|uniref:Surface protein n=1 Tax=Xylocopilactobacillus apis TaxID=2932183 RepID=A0AAU9CX77_9LACO|nr:BspA family leucine-rich repeat surface protein [Xylocopilactobacillus apis]BDR55903.1 hypothetical protein KIMC2_04650 [Xylocopilactobacillus apis]